MVLCDTLWQQRRQMEKQSSELRVSFSLPSKNRSLKFPNLKMPFISYLRRSNWSLNFLCTPSHCSRHAKKCLREPFEKAINFSHLLLPGLTRWRKARRIPSFTVFLSQIFISCIFLLLCFINIKIELWCFMIIFTWLIVRGSSATGKGKLHVHDGFFFWRACPLVPLKKNKTENCDFSLFLVFLHQFCIRWYTNKSTNGYSRWHTYGQVGGQVGRQMDWSMIKKNDNDDDCTMIMLMKMMMMVMWIIAQTQGKVNLVHKYLNLNTMYWNKLDFLTVRISHFFKCQPSFTVAPKAWSADKALC